MNQAVATMPSKSAGNLVNRMASRFGVDQTKLLSTLKNTAFKIKNGEATNEQMMALMVVADQHGLNPFTREIYAFEDSNRGVVPVVGVDGWSRIINSHPQFDGMDFEQDKNNEWCTCIIYRKDRAHPIKVTEYLSECKRGTGPWNSHPRRMLRHKAMIQCARLAFSFSGIFDPDEAEAIVERDDTVIDVTPERPSRPDLPNAKLLDYLDHWRDTIAAGDREPEQAIAMIESKYAMTDEQKAEFHALSKEDNNENS